MTEFSSVHLHETGYTACGAWNAWVPATACWRSLSVSLAFKSSKCCAVVFLGTLALLWLKSWWDMRNAVPLDVSAACGDITPEELAKHDGRDPFKPIYFSVQGRVFDVTAGRDFYGPGAPAAALRLLIAPLLDMGRAYGVTDLRKLGWPLQRACSPSCYGKHARSSRYCMHFHPD